MSSEQDRELLKLARAKVFRDPKGNRMLFPSMIYYSRDDEPLATNLWNTGMSMRIATGLEMEDGWLEFDPSKFPNIRTEIGSRGFLHGGATVLLFAGPEFDTAAALAKGEGKV